MPTTTPEAHGALGNDSANDGPAIQAALNTGKHVEFDPTKRYRFSSPVNVTAAHQTLIGGGLKPMGGMPSAVRVSNCRDVVIDLAMYCANQTDGFAVDFHTNAERCTVRRLLINDSGYNVIHVQQSNCITIQYAHAIALRGQVGIRWYGTDSMRSDILNVRDTFLGWSPSSVRGAIGMDWFGYCHSLRMDNFHAVGQPGGNSTLAHGIVIRNNPGATQGPIIGRFDACASDFTFNHGIYISAGDDIIIDGLYQNGSVIGSGIFVDAKLPDYAVMIDDSKTIGNARFGVESPQTKISANVLAYANGLVTHAGYVSGNIRTR